LVACTGLTSACQTTNGAGATEPFPKPIVQPDGVCPDFTGKYVPLAIAKKGGVYARSGGIELGFQKPTTKVPDRRWIRLSNGEYRPASFEFVEVRHIDPSTVEVTEQYADLDDKVIYVASLIAGEQFCDHSALVNRFTMSGGAEGGRKTTQIVAYTTKEPDGSIVIRRYEDQKSTFFEVVPGPRRRDIVTYRFEPYFAPAK
jgi:hypothetical protein